MLNSIYIENIALIRRLSLETGLGFCAFTGETGAGKSIIIDSLGLLCGARSDRDIIRTGEDEALVEGIFFVSDEKTLKKLKELETEPDEDGSFTVTRRLSRDGRSSAKINGRNIPLSRLKAIAALLLSIHGQQDTQAFADTERQLELLDSFAHNEEILKKHSEKFGIYKDIRRRIDALSADEREKEMKLDMLKYRINELKGAGVYVGEKDELEAERKLLANREKILSNASRAYGELYGKDGSAEESIEAAISAVETLSGIIPEFDALAQRLESAKYEIIDVADTVKAQLDDDGGNPEARLDEVETRLSLIKRLETKYKAEADEFTSLLEEWEEELDAFENSEAELEKLKAELEKAKRDAFITAKELSDRRKGASETLCGRVKEELSAVDMKGVSFGVDFTEKEISEDGKDEICFMISANKGEEPKPMAKIASGGELSRIMLCLKCVFADCESIGTLIFDEIDSGVSGSTSEKIGIRLKKATCGKKTQVICVTHSAVLAARADAHYKISKSVKGDRTETDVELLNRDGRIAEIARILGGVDVSDTVIKAAEEMIARGENE